MIDEAHIEIFLLEIVVFINPFQQRQAVQFHLQLESRVGKCMDGRGARAPRFTNRRQIRYFVG